MQPPTAKEVLTVRAANISRSAPEQWRSFLEALAVYVDVHRENLLKSPLTDLPVNQGRAQALSSLMDNLKDCEADADKIRKIKNV